VHAEQQNAGVLLERDLNCRLCALGAFVVRVCVCVGGGGCVACCCMAHMARDCSPIARTLSIYIQLAANPAACAALRSMQYLIFYRIFHIPLSSAAAAAAVAIATYSYNSTGTGKCQCQSASTAFHLALAHLPDLPMANGSDSLSCSCSCTQLLSMPL
jgi:hypothetical protein